jgi:hypothetical protein
VGLLQSRRCDLSRWRRQQRKRSRRAREVAWLDSRLAHDFKACCDAIDRGLAEIRELSIRYAVRSLETKLRREAREEDEARRAVSCR